MAEETNQKTVCVVGADAFNRRLIERIPEASGWRLVDVLESTDVQPPTGTIDFDKLYGRCCEIIDGLDAPPDAIVGHLDFPVTALVSLLVRRYGLIGATPEAVAKCEHKYWMRKEQKKVLPDRTPDVAALNPFEPDAARDRAPAYPFWLKPVMGHSSRLGFMVTDDGDFESALQACRQQIHAHGEPFNAFLAHLDPEDGPPDGVDGNHAVAEELISAGRLFTLEGYVHDGKTTVYGAVESMRESKSASSLTRYHYPGDIPEEIVRDGEAAVGTLLAQIGYDNSPFNVEFFYDEDAGEIRLLEVNARISKSHSPLFDMVDGASHHRQAIRLALGQDPGRPDGGGGCTMASKFMVRSVEADGIVTRVPTGDEIAALQEVIPNLEVKVLVEEGRRMSDLADQDSYSYELMDIFIGGDSHGLVEDAYLRCRDSLELHVKPMPARD